MELHLIVIGICLICLGLVHAIFPKQFKWKEELSLISIVNRDMMYVHTFFIAFTLVLVGLFCLTSTNEIINTPLGKRVALGLGIYWIARFLVQFFGYSSKTWRGKRKETTVHILFAIFWAYISVVFIMIFASGS